MRRKEFEELMDYLWNEDVEFLYSEEFCRSFLTSFFANLLKVSPEEVKIPDENIQEFREMILSCRATVEEQNKSGDQ